MKVLELYGSSTGTVDSILVVREPQGWVNHRGVLYQGRFITRLEALVVGGETDQPKNECYKHGNKQWDFVTNINIKVPSNVPQEDHECVFNKHKVVK